MPMIQTEVKTQIKNEMNAIQTEVANLGIKIDTMQVGIQESIATTICGSIRASMTQNGPPAPNQQEQPQQQYPHKAALCPPTHTMHSTQNIYSHPASAMNYLTPNYYEPLQHTGQPQDAAMMTQTFNPNSSSKMATHDASTHHTSDGTSPMETCAQQ
jgi:predicted GTPase